MASSVEELASLLAALSPEEQAILRPVLERDLEFQRRERERISSIKSIVDKEDKQPTRLELTVPGGGSRGNLYSNSSGVSSAESFGSQQSLGSSAVSPLSPLGGRTCLECGTKLGLVFNSGVRCCKCEQLLCDSCRVYPNREKTGVAFCRKCYQHRELLAASGEWTGELGADQPVSAQLLRHLRRESEAAGRVAVRSPDQFRTRNMSLPPISSVNLLGIPSEQRPQSEGSSKFWQGSPSPRSPYGPGALPVPHPREPIGSPAPRPLTPCLRAGFIDEVGTPGEEEDDVLSSPPSSFQNTVDNSRQRRQSWQHSTKTRAQSSLNSSGRESFESTDDRRPEIRRKRNVEDGRGSVWSTASQRHTPANRDSLRVSLSRRDFDSMSISSDVSSVMDSPMDVPTRTASQSSFSSISLSPSSPVGEVEIRLHYELHSACLSISLLRCRRLPILPGGTKPNPYIKMVLIRKGAYDPTLKQKTHCKRATTDPDFDYEVKLPNITKSELEEHTMRLSVCHRDILQHSSILGEIHLPLSNYPWHQEAARFALQGKSEVPPDPTPTPMRTARITIDFSIQEKERKIGTLTVRLQSVKFGEFETKMGPIVVCGKLYFNKKRLGRVQSKGMRIHNPNPGKETAADYTMAFHDVNLNDLHLHMFILSMTEQNGLMSSRPLGQGIVNSVQHRKTLVFPHSCPCPQCSPWHRLISNPSQAICFPLPLQPTVLNDSQLAML